MGVSRRDVLKGTAYIGTAVAAGYISAVKVKDYKSKKDDEKAKQKPAPKQSRGKR